MPLQILERHLQILAGTLQIKLIQKRQEISNIYFVRYDIIYHNLDPDSEELNTFFKFALFSQTCLQCHIFDENP